MTISVVIPVYNRQKKAELALRSVLAQSQRVMEIIVVDDFSHPPFKMPPEMENDGRIRVIRHNQNKGAGAARNTGIDQATGELIAFLDSDDLWHRDKLKSQMNYLTQNESVGDGDLVAYVSGFRLKSAVTNKEGNLQPVSSDQLVDFVSGCWFCPGSTLIIASSTFDIVGAYDENLRRLEDTDWFIRFALAGGKLVSVPGYYADIEAGTKAQSDLIRKNADYLIKKYSTNDADIHLMPGNIRKLKSYLALELAASQVAQKKFLNAGFSLLKSFWYKPRLQLQLRNWWV